MASRPRGYGLTAECKAKIDSKYDPELDLQVRDWIEAVLDIQLDPNTPPGQPLGPKGIQEALKDGIILCQLVNAIMGRQAIKYSESKLAFKQMENTGKFLAACDEYGVAKTDSFQTVDLYEGQNIPQVINGIIALGRKAGAKGYDGPTIGPKEATQNKREFSEEQMKAGQNVIGLQMGSNQGASQSGMTMGKQRRIID